MRGTKNQQDKHASNIVTVEFLQCDRRELALARTVSKLGGVEFQVKFQAVPYLT